MRHHGAGVLRLTRNQRLVDQLSTDFTTAQALEPQQYATQQHTLCRRKLDPVKRKASQRLAISSYSGLLDGFACGDGRGIFAFSSNSK